jgi:hypothetical protein
MDGLGLSKIVLLEMPALGRWEEPGVWPRVFHIWFYCKGRVKRFPLRFPVASDTIGSVRRFAPMSITPTLTVAFAFVTVLIGVLFNNSRIGDLRFTTASRYDDLMIHMNSRFDDTIRHFDDRCDHFIEKLDRMNDNILRILADHDARLRKLEKID